jgi:glutathione peroxidase|tara:strand:- start:1558 stop:2118 length:561 start_codon:yes stop_codon:yes gene_type:complete
MHAMKTKLLSILLFAAIPFAAIAKKDSLHDVKLKDIDGKEATLADYKGKVVLVVNVASRCGLTKQYKELEAIHRKYKAKGFSVLGFPCNDFGGQEPGSNKEIKEFCSSRYDVTFPMFDKLSVKAGPKQHELYKRLTGKNGAFPGNVKWNFGKFLVGKDGKPLQRFEPRDKPDAPKVTEAIEKALSK